MNLIKFIKTISPLERRTFYLHVSYFSLEGIILGVLALNEFVFLKSLGGSDWGVSLLFQFGVFVLTFSFLLNEWAERTSNKKKFLFQLGILTRLPLMVFVFFPSDILGSANLWLYHYTFLAVFLIYYFANPIIYPAINRLLKHNYAASNFGVLYSYATQINKVIMLVVTFFYGWMLDINPNAYRYVLPAIACIGIVSVGLLSIIPYTIVSVKKDKQSLLLSIQHKIKEMKSRIQSNKPFKDFEIGFMYYGFAFMGTVSVIAIYFSQELGLNYSSVAFYKNSYNLLAILLLPLFGRLLGKMDPRKFAGITFASLFFYLLFINLTEVFPWFFEFSGIKIYFTLLIAMLCNGVFAATMSLLWSIGSAYFCRKDEASEYQAIHLSFTGLRSFFAPVLGLGVYLVLGFTGTFVLGMLLLLIAIILSMFSYRRHKLHKNLAEPTTIITDSLPEK